MHFTISTKEFEPEFDGDLRVWKSKYLYPPRLDLDKNEYQDWILETISKWRELDETQEWKDDFYFDKIIYWKLVKSSNVTIKRDKSGSKIGIQFWRIHGEELNIIV